MWILLNNENVLLKIKVYSLMKMLKFSLTEEVTDYLLFNINSLLYLLLRKKNWKQFFNFKVLKLNKSSNSNPTREYTIFYEISIIQFFISGTLKQLYYFIKIFLNIKLFSVTSPIYASRISYQLLQDLNLAVSI